MNRPTTDCSNLSSGSVGFVEDLWNRRLSIKVSSLVYAATLAALWLALWPVTSIASRCVLAAILMTWVFGCWRTRRATLAILPAMYLPHSWIFLIRDYPWNEYRRLWASMFWQMPGLVPFEWIRFVLWPTETFRFAGMAAIAIVIWLVAVSLARRGGRWLWITAIVVFAISILFSRLEQILFRA